MPHPLIRPEVSDADFERALRSIHVIEHACDMIKEAQRMFPYMETHVELSLTRAGMVTAEAAALLREELRQATGFRGSWAIPGV
jgi:hypothetical protein